MSYKHSFKYSALKGSSNYSSSWMISAVSGVGRATALCESPASSEWLATKDSCWRKQHKQASSSIQCEACRVAVRRLLRYLDRDFPTKDLQLPQHEVTMPNTQPPTNAKLQILTNLSGSLSNFLFIVFFLFASFTDSVSARNTLLIVGHSRNNVYKTAFVEQFIHNFSHVQIDYTKEFTVFKEDNEPIDKSDDWNQEIGGVKFTEGNISCLIISQKGTDQMSLTQISIFYQHAKTASPMVVIEIGNGAIQTHALLTKIPLCWGLSRAQIPSPNRAYLCNDVYLPDISIIDSRNVQSLGEYEEYNFQIREPESRLWPCIFASATKTEKKYKKRYADTVNEEEVEDMVDKIMEDLTQRKYEGLDKDNEVDDRLHKHKLHCKYRKSCYETGDVPHIEKEESLIDRISVWFSQKSVEGYNELKLEKLDKRDLYGDGIPDSEDDDLNLTPLKYECKYRISCYKEYGIPLSKSDEEKEERRSILARSAPQTGKKKTLKDIAERTVKKVKEAENKAAGRPLPKTVLTERILDEIEEQLTKKLKCKYRQSCYETGNLPAVDSSYHIPVISTYIFTESATTENTTERNYDDMEEFEQKVYCKYRKSCYESGVKPVIEPEIQFNSIRDLRELPDMIETRKLTLQERCKYRKSCYESGVLPDLHAHQMEKVMLKEVSSVIPTSETGLKVLCKYRKSCYHEIAESATVDTVRHIRKRRLIEKEVRKRAQRGARLRRKLKIDVEDRHGYHRRPTRKEKKRSTEKDAEETEKPMKKLRKQPVSVEVKEVEDSSQVDSKEQQEPEVKKKKKSKKLREPGSEAPVDEVPKMTAKPKKMKNVQKNDAESEAIVVDKTKHRKLKKTREATLERDDQTEEQSNKEKLGKRINSKELETEVVRMKEEVSHQPIKERETITTKKQDGANIPVDLTQADIADDDWKHSKKEKCKYRRSCYQSGEAPIIEQSVASLFTSFSRHVESEYDRESHIRRSEVDQKLDCKYRKSCYETGNLPDLTIPEMINPYEFYEFHDGITARKLKCKYRKSCYEDQGIDEGRERTIEQEEARKPSIKAATRDKVTHSSRDKKSEKAKTSQGDKDDDEHQDDEEGEKREKIIYPSKEAHASSELIGGEKADCKYRKSCYQGVEPRAMNEDHSGTIARTKDESPIRTKCNVYYLSCREQMGLPPKEKAPMGPSGRRLCRKKKD